MINPKKQGKLFAFCGGNSLGKAGLFFYYSEIKKYIFTIFE